jgi:CelD/BcsL family acetyltransferase involved in cellulose biosynthesis
MVMIGLVAQDSIANGLTEYDFLRGDEAFKFHWTDRVRETRTLRFFDTRLRSHAALAGFRLCETIGRGKRLIRAAQRGLNCWFQ